MLRAERLGGHPHAEFVILEPGLEIADQDVNQVLLLLIELAEMCTPRRIADYAESGVSHVKDSPAADSVRWQLSS